MASSSLVAAAPHRCYTSPRADSRCLSFSRTDLLTPRSFPGSRADRRSLHHELRRCQHFGFMETTNGKSRLGSTWKSHIYRFNETYVTNLSSRHLCCVTRFRSHYKLVGHIKMSTSGVFTDKSTFPIPKRAVFNNGKPARIPWASLGPDEPHVASTSCSETILEKQALGFWDPEAEKAELESFFSSPLPSHPKLHRGQLKNGLRYLILPNKVPANRFEAHMEVHVGSIDEEDDEQGIAHMIEHVAFLGSKKREKLLGTGARSNAYTDFHHTVFHIHSPTSTKDSDGDLLPFVLDALNEIAFYPKFLPSRVEKERRAILSELQMMNTIEYRVDCQLLQHLHSENKLSKRFPIGLEEQIKIWDAEKIRRFHERWYFPANATLYLVGDIDDIHKALYQIEAVFGRALEEKEAPPVHTPSAFGAMANFLVPKLPSGLPGSLSHERPALLDQSKLIKKERHAVRPPVQHIWSLPESGQIAKPPHVFQHELIQNFSINMFCKIPVNSVRSYGDLRIVLMKRIFLSALHFRINTRYKESQGISNSGEGSWCVARSRIRHHGFQQIIPLESSRNQHKGNLKTSSKCLLQAKSLNFLSLTF